MTHHNEDSTDICSIGCGKTFRRGSAPIRPPTSVRNLRTGATETATRTIREPATSHTALSTTTR